MNYIKINSDYDKSSLEVIIKTFEQKLTTVCSEVEKGTLSMYDASEEISEAALVAISAAHEQGILSEKSKRLHKGE